MIKNQILLILILTLIFCNFSFSGRCIKRSDIPVFFDIAYPTCYPERGSGDSVTIVKLLVSDVMPINPKPGHLIRKSDDLNFYTGHGWRSVFHHHHHRNCTCPAGPNTTEIYNLIHDLQNQINLIETGGCQNTCVNGTNGKDGVDGKDGNDGINGKDANTTEIYNLINYLQSQINLIETSGCQNTCVNGTNGNDGLNGKDGVDGKDGKDANSTEVYLMVKNGIENELQELKYNDTEIRAEITQLQNTYYITFNKISLDIIDLFLNDANLTARIQNIIVTGSNILESIKNEIDLKLIEINNILQTLNLTDIYLQNKVTEIIAELGTGICQNTCVNGTNGNDGLNGNDGKDCNTTDITNIKNDITNLQTQINNIETGGCLSNCVNGTNGIDGKDGKDSDESILSKVDHPYGYTTDYNAVKFYVNDTLQFNSPINFINTWPISQYQEKQSLHIKLYYTLETETVIKIDNIVLNIGDYILYDVRSVVSINPSCTDYYGFYIVVSIGYALLSEGAEIFLNKVIPPNTYECQTITQSYSNEILTTITNGHYLNTLFQQIGSGCVNPNNNCIFQITTNELQLEYLDNWLKINSSDLYIGKTYQNQLTKKKVDSIISYIPGEGFQSMSINYDIQKKIGGDLFVYNIKRERIVENYLIQDNDYLTKSDMNILYYETLNVKKLKNLNNIQESLVIESIKDVTGVYMKIKTEFLYLTIGSNFGIPFIKSDDGSGISTDKMLLNYNGVYGGTVSMFSADVLLYIKCTGSITASSFSIDSDERLKTSIYDFDYNIAITFINSLNVKTFQFIEGINRDSVKINVGFTANSILESEKNLPQNFKSLVTKSNTTIGKIKYEDLLSIAPMDLIPHIISYIQVLDKRLKIIETSHQADINTKKLNYEKRIKNLEDENLKMKNDINELKNLINSLIQK